MSGWARRGRIIENSESGDRLRASTFARARQTGSCQHRYRSIEAEGGTRESAARARLAHCMPSEAIVTERVVDWQVDFADARG